MHQNLYAARRPSDLLMETNLPWQMTAVCDRSEIVEWAQTVPVIFMFFLFLALASMRHKCIFRFFMIQ